MTSSVGNSRQALTSTADSSSRELPSVAGSDRQQQPSHNTFGKTGTQTHSSSRVLTGTGTLLYPVPCGQVAPPNYIATLSTTVPTTHFLDASEKAIIIPLYSYSASTVLLRVSTHLYSAYYQKQIILFGSAHRRASSAFSKCPLRKFRGSKEVFLQRAGWQYCNPSTKIQSYQKAFCFGSLQLRYCLLTINNAANRSDWSPCLKATIVHNRVVTIENRSVSTEQQSDLPCS